MPVLHVFACCSYDTQSACMLQAELHGIVPVAEGQFQTLHQASVNWSNRLKQALASCHGLTLINRTSTVGDEVERSLFKSVEARYRVSDLLQCLPW